nr:hypothetical protein [Tanacetum cinerariifolium]
IPTFLPTVLPTVPPSPDHTLASPDYSPASPDYIPASPDYSPASDKVSYPSEDPSSDHIPPLPAILPFLSSTDDTTDNDTPNTPPTPTHGIPFTEITPSTQISPIIPHRRVMILAPGQPIPYCRSYQYHLNGPLHMLTVWKRVGPHSLLDHSSPDLLSTSTGPSRKRRRSPMASVPALSPIFEALSLVCADLIPSPKRIRNSDYLADVEVDPRESFELSKSSGSKDIGLLRLTQQNMPNTRFGASMTHEEVEELISSRVAEEMEARKAVMILEPLNECRDEQEGENGENRNGNRGN